MKSEGEKVGKSRDVKKVLILRDFGKKLGDFALDLRCTAVDR